jgi:hypothetical protein
VPKGRPGITYIEFDCQACGARVRRESRLRGKATACNRACAARLLEGGRLARFWRRVQRSDGCWLWTGARNPAGYGVIRPKAGRMIRVHRYSWELHFGAIPFDKEVCHTCDVRNCVRPDHLWLGTHEENVADMVAKGRNRSGRPRKVAA